MATYIELQSLRGSTLSSPLREKINVAITIKANILAKLPTPTAAQVAWSKAALESPESFQNIVLNYILADYHTQTTTVIQNATDAQVQTAVNAAVDTLLGV
jgi:hypothetical protein